MFALGRLACVSTTLPLTSLQLGTFRLEMSFLATLETSHRAASTRLVRSRTVLDSMVHAATSNTSPHGLPALTRMVPSTFGTLRSATRGLASVHLVPFSLFIICPARWATLWLSLKLSFLSQVRLQKSHPFNQFANGVDGADRSVGFQFRL